MSMTKSFPESPQEVVRNLQRKEIELDILTMKTIALPHFKIILNLTVIGDFHF